MLLDIGRRLLRSCRLRLFITGDAGSVPGAGCAPTGGPRWGVWGGVASVAAVMRPRVDLPLREFRMVRNGRASDRHLSPGETCGSVVMSRREPSVTEPALTVPAPPTRHSGGHAPSGRLLPLPGLSFLLGKVGTTACCRPVSAISASLASTAIKHDISETKCLINRKPGLLSGEEAKQTRGGRSWGRGHGDHVGGRGAGPARGFPRRGSETTEPPVGLFPGTQPARSHRWPPTNWLLPAQGVPVLQAALGPPVSGSKEATMSDTDKGFGPHYPLRFC